MVSISGDKKTEKRGYRNKNPGNLKISSIDWNGKVPVSKNTDGTFEQFISDHYGIRAAALDVVNDIVKDGKNTIEKLIKEYAPPSENKTYQYIDFVAKKTKLSPYIEFVPNTAIILEILKAIFTMENGFNKYTDMQIISAIDDGAGKKYGLS